MAQVYPFRAFRYNPARAPFERVLTQPYDKISPAMQEQYYAADPHNLIAVEKGRVYPSDTPQNNVYTRAGAAIEDWIRSNIVMQDPALLTRRNTRRPRQKNAARGADLSARENSKNIRRVWCFGMNTRFPDRRRTGWNCCGTRKRTRDNFSCCIRMLSEASMEFWRRLRHKESPRQKCAMNTAWFNTAWFTGCG